MKGKKLSRRGFVGALTAAAGTPLAAKMTSWKDRTPEKKDGKVTGYRMLGRTGFRVSDIGLGGVELTTPALVTAALDAGINYIDTAEGYMRGQSEINIGKASRRMPRPRSLSCKRVTCYRVALFLQVARPLCSRPLNSPAA